MSIGLTILEDNIRCNLEMSILQQAVCMHIAIGAKTNSACRIIIEMQIIKKALNKPKPGVSFLYFTVIICVKHRIVMR